MKEHDIHECGKIGRRTAVLCAALGVGVALLMLKAMGASIPMFSDLMQHFVIGLYVLFLAAALLGTMVGKFLCDRGKRSFADLAGGLVVAFGSICSSVLTASIWHMLFESPHRGIEDWLAALTTPLLVVLIFGGMPAIFLAFVYGWLVRRQLNRMVQ